MNVFIFIFTYLFLSSFVPSSFAPAVRIKGDKLFAVPFTSFFCLVVSKWAINVTYVQLSGIARSAMHLYVPFGYVSSDVCVLAVV